MPSLRLAFPVAAILSLAACGNDETAPSLAPSSERADLFVTASEFPVSATSATELSFGATTDGGTNVLIPLTIDDAITTKLFTQSGTLLHTINTGRTGKQPLAAFDGTRYLVAWADRTDADAHAWGLFVKTDGTRYGQPFQLSTTAHVRKVIGVAFSGGRYLVAYVTETNTIAGRFVLPDGTLGSTITIRNNANLSGYANVAGDGTDFLAIWQDAALTKVQARLVHSADGSMTDPVTVTSSQVADAPVGVAFAGGEYMVMWNRQLTTNTANPYVRRITTAGALFGGNIRVDSLPGWIMGTSIVPLGTKFQVMYQKLAATGGIAWGTPVAANGTLGTRHTYAKKNTTTNQVPIVFGVQSGSWVFVVVMRAVTGSNFKSLQDMTSFDVYASAFSP